MLLNYYYWIGLVLKDAKLLFRSPASVHGAEEAGKWMLSDDAGRTEVRLRIMLWWWFHLRLDPQRIVSSKFNCFLGQRKSCDCISFHRWWISSKTERKNERMTLESEEEMGWYWECCLPARSFTRNGPINQSLFAFSPTQEECFAEFFRDRLLLDWLLHDPIALKAAAAAAECYRTPMAGN